MIQENISENKFSKKKKKKNRIKKIKQKTTN